MKTVVMACVLAAIFIISARGQGFVNLNFESAYNLPGSTPIPDGVEVPATNAIPGWAAYGATAPLSPLSYVTYVSNYVSGFSTDVELEGGSLALSGDYSAALFGLGSISQTGMVPDNAESLQFEVSYALGLNVALGGQDLSYSILSEGTGYDVYGANIPADLDGQSETLTFFLTGLGGGTLLDNIEFSSSVVPEPGERALIGIGVVVLGLSRLRPAVAGRRRGRAEYLTTKQQRNEGRPNFWFGTEK